MFDGSQQAPDPRQLAYMQESARQRRQSDLARSELRRTMEDDGSGAPQRRSLPVLVAALVSLAVAVITVIIVLVLTGMVHV